MRTEVQLTRAHLALPPCAVQLFDDGALKPLKPLMAPVLDVVRTSPTGIYVAYGLVMTPILLIVTLVLLLSKQVRACLPVLYMYRI